MDEMDESGGGMQQNDTDNAGQEEDRVLNSIQTGRLWGKEEAIWWKKQQLKNKKRRTKTMVGELRKARERG